jgi:two-component system, NtrC family, nitrogen regulation sensor histidine kinase NtrY
MSTKHEHRTLTFWLLISCATSAALTAVVLKGLPVPLIALLGIALVSELVQILQLSQARNRKLSTFFDAIRNDDTSLVFPEQSGDASMRKLHASLNNLNKQIGAIKLKSERNELFYRELIEQSSTGLLSFDEAGYIDVINSAAKRYLGVVQLANLKLLSQKNPGLYQTITQLQVGERITVKTLVGNQLESLAIQAADMQFGDQRHRLLSIQNIRHELEEMEIDSWQKLIRVMTHEIMNSIAPITSLSQTLLSFYRKQQQNIDPALLTPAIVSDTVEGLSVIEERGKGLIHFVDNYRKLAKVPQPTFATLDLKAWMQGFTLLFKPTLQQHNIQFHVSVGANLTTIQTDEKLLDQILINLMTNAIEAVCDKADGEERKIRLSVHETSGKSVVLELSDNGAGIDENLMDKIFVPFFTTKEGGNGIGLSLSRQLASKLNMKLSVRSHPGQGSIFQLEC